MITVVIQLKKSDNSKPREITRQTFVCYYTQKEIRRLYF